MTSEAKSFRSLTFDFFLVFSSPFYYLWLVPLKPTFGGVMRGKQRSVFMFAAAGNWLGTQIGNYLKNNSASIKQSAQALLNNNAKYFGSYGSDLPPAALAPIVQAESVGKDPYTMVSESLNALSAEPSDFNIPAKRQYPNTGYRVTPSVKAEIDFLNADLAKHYGMSATTAYQEALSNTSYQRAVKDMQAAGLNPAVMFGSGRAQGASPAVYASQGSSGSGSRSGYRGRSGATSNDKLFSGSAYSAIQVVGGIIGAAVTKSPTGYWIGSEISKGAMGLMDAVSKFIK